MVQRAAARPGGRSARVQQSVHDAVRALLPEHGREGLSVPLIAAKAGVTPSTVYRRWGDLQELLADVAVERLRPDGPPRDEGSLPADLEAWAVQFLEEMASGPGRAYIHDAVAGDPGGSSAGRCSEYTVEQIGVLLARAAQRGEPAPSPDHLLDVVIAPIMYRILFRPGPLEPDYARSLVRRALAR